MGLNKVCIPYEITYKQHYTCSQFLIPQLNFQRLKLEKGLLVNIIMYQINVKDSLENKQYKQMIWLITNTFHQYL